MSDDAKAPWFMALKGGRNRDSEITLVFDVQSHIEAESDTEISFPTDEIILINKCKVIGTVNRGEQVLHTIEVITPDDYHSSVSAAIDDVWEKIEVWAIQNSTYSPKRSFLESIRNLFSPICA